MKSKLFIAGVAILFFVLIFFFLSKYGQRNPFYYRVRSLSYYMFNRIVLSFTHETNYKNSDKKVIVCFGDSITGGDGVEAEESYPYVLSMLSQCRVIPLGQNGATTLDGLKNIKKIFDHNPDIVVLQFGGNDLSRGFDWEYVQYNLYRKIEIIRDRLPLSKIVIMLSHHPLYLETLLKENDKTGNVHIFNIYPLIREHIDRKTKHPNSLAHRMIAQKCMDLIDRCIDENKKRIAY